MPRKKKAPASPPPPSEFDDFMEVVGEGLDADELERSLQELPAELLDRWAFGFESGTVMEVKLDDIDIVHNDDLENAKYQANQASSVKTWARGFVFSADEPVEIRLRDGNLVLEDGHHRYLASQILRRPSIWAVVIIEDNPVVALMKRGAVG